MDKRELIEKMIILLNNGLAFGFCRAAAKAQQKDIFSEYTEKELLRQIPELDEHRPNLRKRLSHCGFWFEPRDKQKRVDILNTILKELENE